MKQVVFTCLCTFLTFSLSTFGGVSAQTVQPALIYSGPPPKEAVSINSLIPPNQQISPMTLTERLRLAAVPKRGMCSTAPAARADNALLSGNGKMWVEVYGDPFAEQIVFHQERLLQPWRNHPLDAPKIASVLPEVRGLMLNGEYKKALDLSLAAAEKTDTKPGTSNLKDHPAFDMRIDVAGRHAVENYLRTTDFESGEVRVTWTDKEGVWERRTFVSLPDNAIVQLLTSPHNGAINATLRLDTSVALPEPPPTDSVPSVIGREIQAQPSHEPGADQIRFSRSFDEHHLILRRHYVVDHGNPGYASVTRVIADGGSVSIVNNALVVQGVHALTLITRIEAYPDLEEQSVSTLEQAVDDITPDFQTLLDRHRPGQASVMDRVSVDFGGDSLHSMSGEEMLSDQRSRLGYNPALLQDLFDMGRYWLYLRSGDFPPMWGHVNINVNLQVSGAVMGDLPEATNSYAHWLESLLPDSETNAANIFGARGALFAIHPTV
jgi:hypothetical protein